MQLMDDLQARIAMGHGGSPVVTMVSSKGVIHDGWMMQGGPIGVESSTGNSGNQAALKGFQPTVDSQSATKSGTRLHSVRNATWHCGTGYSEALVSDSLGDRFLQYIDPGTVCE